MSADLKVGEIVKRGNVRGQIILIYENAPYVLVCTFPQDVGWIDSLMYQTWEIKELGPRLR